MVHAPFNYARQAAHAVAKAPKDPHISKDGFLARIDVHHFEPSEITVKTIDNTVVVEGKHEEKEDGHGSVRRHFIRKYMLPKDYDVNAIQSLLSSDGVLTVKVPPPKAIGGEVRNVPITHTKIAAHHKANESSPAVKSPAVKSPVVKSPAVSK